MMSGITSPARPWFRLTTPDPALAEVGSVKNWLYYVGDRMSTAFLRSNLYNVLPIVYGDMGTFGTGCMLVEEDVDDVIRCYPFPIGSYTLANNYKLQVDVFQREFRLTVRQLVQRFGRRTPDGKLIWDNFSTHVKNAYDRGQLEQWIDVCHVIEPNEDYDPNKFGAKFKKYKSCYYEKGVSGQTQTAYTGADGDKVLRESGYDYFPVLAPRWEVNGEDVYGTDCPGMTALGDIKALQLMQKRKSQAIEKMVFPPMVGPSSMRSAKASLLPGDLTYVDEREGTKGFRAAHEVNLRLSDLVGDIQEHQRRIQRSFYEDLFLMLASTDRREITAREIDERHEEKLLALGPVLEQLNQDLLDPLIDIAFNIGMKQGLFPPPPEEIQGVDLKVEYVSIMAQSQKLVGIAGIERFASFAVQVAQVHPESLDKIDTDQMLDVYSDITSVNPSIIRTDEMVEEIRAQRQKAAQAAQAAEMAKQMTGAAKDLSQADMEGDNALTRMLQQGNAGSLVEGL
jgi:hypothetical protein